MISATDFKNGMTIDIDGIVYSVMEFQHVKPGKGAAFVRTKLRNLTNGGVIDKTFRPTEKMPKAHIERQNLEYLYSDEDMYHFMDQQNFEQIAVNRQDIGDSLKFIKENVLVQILTYNSKIFGIEPPISVELEVIETEPGFKGDTAQGANKPATVETGASVGVPLFVNVGDIIKIDTRTGEYTGRA
jgi:elongation factor P